MKGLIRWNPSSGRDGRYELVLESRQSVVLTRSKYLTRMVSIVENQEPVAAKAKIDSYTVVSKNPKESKGLVALDECGASMDDVAERPQYTINEKFEFMGDMLDMVINKSSAAMLITGRGGIGKTHSTLERLHSAGLVDKATLEPSISDLDEIGIDDTEEEMEEKALAEMNRPSGDYVVVKGRVTAKACYRILYENRNKIVLFDDCDSVLENADCVSILKSALDTYEDRYVSWRTEQAFGESDLPQSFKFSGSIIFITNLPMSKVDEAVRTRCLKVDVSMTTEQRIERMRAVLDTVMPSVDMEYKLDALRVLEENKDLTDDINFRSLMNTINFRAQDKPNWEKIAQFSLLEQ